MAGGQVITMPLFGEERQLVEEVMAFENGQANLQQYQNPVPGPNPGLAAILAPVPAQRPVPALRPVVAQRLAERQHWRLQSIQAAIRPFVQAAVMIRRIVIDLTAESDDKDDENDEVSIVGSRSFIDLTSDE